jgi:Ca2+-binding RTX toxin-like protein
VGERHPHRRARRRLPLRRAEPRPGRLLRPRQRGDGARGDDRIEGLDGDDEFPSPGLDGADEYSGGGGSDHVDYGNRTAPLEVDIDNFADDGQTGEGDNVRFGIDKVSGGGDDDLLVGNSADNILVGGGGADELFGVEANDQLLGGAGADGLSGGRDDDVLDGGADADVLAGDSGRDRADYTWSPAGVKVTLDGGANDGVPGEGDNVWTSVEDVTGSLLSDVLLGNSGANELLGLAGNDDLLGNGGPDHLVGGRDSDRLFGGFGDDELDGVDQVGGNDRLLGEGDTDTCASDGGDAEAGCEA